MMVHKRQWQRSRGDLRHGPFDRRQLLRRAGALGLSLPALASMEHKGATGTIRFDEKGDRKDAEITIFAMKGTKIAPVAVVKGGKPIKFDEFMRAQAAADAAGASAPAGAPADPGGKPSEPAKDAAGK